MVAHNSHTYLVLEYIARKYNLSTEHATAILMAAAFNYWTEYSDPSLLSTTLEKAEEIIKLDEASIYS